MAGSRSHYRTEEVPFPEAEYEQRLTRVRDRMDDADLDLLYCTEPESLYYLTGYRNSWFKSHSPQDWPPITSTVVSRDHEGVLFLEAAEDEYLARSTTSSVVSHLRLYRRDENPSGAPFVPHAIEEQGWLGERVGFEKRSHRPSPAFCERLEAAFEEAGSTVTDATDVVRGARVEKSNRELAATRTAAGIADRAMETAVERIEPGMTELELKGEIERAMAREGGEHAGIETYVLAGDRTGQVHAFASRNVINSGDVVLVDFCGVFDRYHADLARTISVGEPHPAVARRAAKAARAMDEVADLVAPGVPLTDVMDVARSHFEEEGIWEHREWVGGYELGIAFPPDWVGAFKFEDGDDGDRRLQPGTVINFESQVHLPRQAGRFGVIDTIAVEADGADVLSNLQHDLFVAE